MKSRLRQILVQLRQGIGQGAIAPSRGLVVSTITIDYRDYLKRVTAIHTEMVQRLADNERTNPLELAALFEDAANRYLDIAEDIQSGISQAPNCRLEDPRAHARSLCAPDPVADSED